jgi:hypothetical protein
MVEFAKQSDGKIWHKAALGLFLLLVLVGCMTVGDYGLAWDEEFRFQGGDDNLTYYQELFSGKSPEHRTSNYPGLFDLPLALAHDAFPDLGTRSQKGHVWSLCFGFLGLLSVWRMTARIGGERAGFFALLFLATLPRYYGHMFFNPKDIPLAGTYALGCWALVSLFSRVSESSWRHIIWVGVAAGLAMSCRIAGLLILAYFALFVGLYLFYKYAVAREPVKRLPGDLGFWALRGAVSGLVAFVILFVFWPKLHVNPFTAISSSVEQAQSFGWGGMVLMDGYFWDSQNLPFYYLPYWLFRTVPEHLLIFIGLGGLLGSLSFYALVRSGQRLAAEVWLPRCLLVFTGVFPIVYIIWKDPVLYDGMRHIIFALLPLVSLAALGLEWCLRRASAGPIRWLPRAIMGVTLFAAAIVAYEMVRLHPYQYVYFNKISGGLPAAYMRDDTDYWGLSHKEAGEWLNAYIESVDPDSGKVYKVHQRYSRWMLREALDPTRFEMSKPREGADFFVSITRFNLHASYPEAELIHIVERLGTPLCFVFRLPDTNEINETSDRP